MTSKEDAKAAIYARLANAPTFHPANAKVFTDWTLESGDIVSMQYGEDSYNLPIYSMDMVWKGVPNVTIGNTGSKERPPLEKMAQKESSRGGSAYRANRKRQTRLEWIVGIDEETGEYFVDHPGYIAIAINEQTGESTVNIDADKIKIGSSGTTEIVLADLLGLYEGMLWAKGDLYVTAAGGQGSGKLVATEVHIGASGNRSIVFDAGHGESSVSLSRGQVNTLVNDNQLHVKVVGPNSSGVYTIYYLPACATSFVPNPTSGNHGGWISAGTITVPRE